jgi:hypothetical protein
MRGRTPITAAAVLSVVLVVAFAIPASPQAPPPRLTARAFAQADPAGEPLPLAPDDQNIGSSLFDKLELDLHTIVALPLATLLGGALALRPRRRGTPKRSSQVVQTQIILSIIGALVMIVVGNSLARAFGVVGAAGLVRYRAKIDDPKDAGVMLTTLAVGLACGIGVYGIALFATGFIITMLLVIESLEPTARKQFILEIHSKGASKLQPQLEALLRRRRVRYELRESTPEEVSYFVELPIEMKTEGISAEIIDLDKDPGTGVEWKTERKKAA